MSRVPRWLRLAVGAMVLAVLVWRVGAGPFLAGALSINGLALVAAVGFGAVSTVCCAWRWTVVARGLGLALPLRDAVRACYRSQFLNTVLPGGVVGDAHRAVRHGRQSGDLGGGIRAVIVERVAGQVVLFGLAALVLPTMASPVRAGVAALAIPAAAVAVVVTWLVVLGRRRTDRRPLRGGRQRLRLNGSAWVRITVASLLALAGHVATFLVASRGAGVTAGTFTLLPLAVLILLAMGVPLTIGGWGPREGVAAWSFGAAGHGAAQGVSVSVGYGLLVIVACLPGAVVLLTERAAVPAVDRGLEVAGDV